MTGLCAVGLKLYRRLGESGRPMASSMQERRAAARSALNSYVDHTKICPQCGARKELAA